MIIYETAAQDGALLMMRGVASFSRGSAVHSCGCLTDLQLPCRCFPHKWEEFLDFLATDREFPASSVWLMNSQHLCSSPTPRVTPPGHMINNLLFLLVQAGPRLTARAALELKPHILHLSVQSKDGAERRKSEHLSAAVGTGSESMSTSITCLMPGGAIVMAIRLRVHMNKEHFLLTRLIGH